MPRAASALLLLLLTACADSALLTGITGPELDFVSSGRSFWGGFTSGAAVGRPRVEAWPGRIVVRGTITLPTTCSPVTGRLRARRGDLLLRVRIEPLPRDRACGDAVGHREYLATITALERGRYRLRVRHESVRGGWAAEVFDDVRVP